VNRDCVMKSEFTCKRLLSKPGDTFFDTYPPVTAECGTIQAVSREALSLACIRPASIALGTNRQFVVGGLARESVYLPLFQWTTGRKIIAFLFSSALARSMANTAFGSAVPGFGHVAIRTNASLGMKAPEQAVGRLGRCGVSFGENKLPFPAQRAAQVRMIGIEALGFRNHAVFPNPAFKMARVRATRASCTL